MMKEKAADTGWYWYIESDDTLASGPMSDFRIGEEMKGEDVLCDVCGKSMTMPNGETTLIGIQIELVPNETMDEPLRQWYAEQVAPFELEREYCVCFPCWLFSLGVRPIPTMEEPNTEPPGDPLIIF